jgi:hypothetical protein
LKESAMSNFASYIAYVPTHEVFEAGPQIRQEAPVHRVGMNEGRVTATSEQAVDRGNSGQVNEYSGTDAWQATARTVSGRAVADIQPETLVEFNGLQAPVSFWVAEGRLAKTADGTYQVPAAAAPVAPAGPDANFSAIPADAMETVNMLLEPLPQTSLDSIQAHAAGVASGRLTQASLVAKFATLAGIPLEDAAARLGVMNAIYGAQTDRSLQTNFGMAASDRTEFFAWCRETKPGHMCDALTRQMQAGDVSAWAPLVTQWAGTVAPTLDACRAGGLPVRGNEVFVKGHWMSPMAATRAGLI